MEDQAVIDVVHTILDVLAGRRNLSGVQADQLHETLTPGYTIAAPTADQIAQAEALLARASATEQVPVSVSATTSGAASEGTAPGTGQV
jgi:hypothetical protein